MSPPGRTIMMKTMATPNSSILYSEKSRPNSGRITSSARYSGTSTDLVLVELIGAQLEETSRGVTSSHHFHNVQCGIVNILSLLEHNNDVVDKADQLSRQASNYITRHDLISSKIGDRDIIEDADRLRAAHEALAGFCFAVEHSQPNSRVRTLGLA